MSASGVIEARRLASRPIGRRPPAAPLVNNATIIEREAITGSIIRLVVRPHDPTPPFVPGQYFALGVERAGRWLARPYSTASSPPAIDGLEFLIRLVPGGTLTPVLWRLRPGEQLRIGPPKGLFRLAAGEPRTQLLVATGTGLAPLMSMATALRGRADRPRTIIVHGVSRVDELAYRRSLEDLAADGVIDAYVPAVSRPAEAANHAWAGRTGRLDSVVGELVRNRLVDPVDVVAYLCGNPAMIESVGGWLHAAGVPETAIIQEQYWTAPG